jgi:multidrug transporter EmrE-like cation transporter
MEPLTSVDFGDIVPMLPAGMTFLLMVIGAGLSRFAKAVYLRFVKGEKDEMEAILSILFCVVGLSLVALTIDGMTVVQGAALGFATSGTLTGISFLGKKGANVAKATAKIEDPNPTLG